jgi:hypothetical protein
MKRILVYCFFQLILLGGALSQTSISLNTSLTNTHYLGWDANTNFDLNVAHLGTFGINFFTDTQLRLIIQANGALNYGTNTLNESSSFGLGNSNTISNNSDHSMAGGNANEVDTCLSCFAYGISNRVGGAGVGDEGCVSLGDSNDSFGHDTFTIGEGNLANGWSSGSIGMDNQTTGFGSVGIGRDNIIGSTTGLIAFLTCQSSVALGCDNIISADRSGSVGADNTIGVGANESYTFGTNLSTTAANSFAFGRGLTANPLLNNQSNTLVIGFNSNVPTLFVGGGNGTVGSFGNVGIGNITSPTQRLDVNGTVRLRSVSAGTPNSLLTGVGTGADVVVNRLDFNANANNFLAGNGTWQCHFAKSGDDLIMGYSTSCSKGRLGVGLTGLGAKLDVYTDEGISSQVGMRVNSIQVTTGTNTNIGSTIRAVGGTSILVGNRVTAAANANAANQSSENIYGIDVSASANGSSNYSGYESIYGIYAAATGDDANNGDIFAGYFNGNIYATALSTPSEETLKTNITSLESSLDKVLAIDIVSYEYNQDATGGMNLPEGQQIGYTAQNLGEYFPGLVTHATQPGVHDEEGNVISESIGFDAVNYVGMVPVLHKAIQEQQNLINTLSATVEELALQLESCCADTKSQESTPDHSMDVKLSNESSPVLFQNTPNPHKGECVIRYFLPEATSIAEIQFFDVQGSILKVVPLNQKGLGLINLDAKDLAIGMYTYALIVDGIAIDMKKMVKE